MLRYIVGTHQLSGLVDADIIQIVPAVRTLEHSAVHFLLLFFRPQNFFNGWQQRKCAEAGFGFEHILADSHRLAIYRVLNDLVLDGDGLLFKVDRIPFQTKDFTSPSMVRICSKRAKDSLEQPQAVPIRT